MSGPASRLYNRNFMARAISTRWITSHVLACVQGDDSRLSTEKLSLASERPMHKLTKSCHRELMETSV